MIDYISYLLFIGSALYLVSSILFFFLFVRTLRTTDGAGLFFLRYLTLAVSAGSFVIFMIRILSEYMGLDLLVARAIAVFNPLILLSVGLYLNYLFHVKNKSQKKGDKPK